MNKSGREKVVSLEELAKTVRRVQAAQKIVALCHGCFDILHCGHLRHFEEAKGMADVLVVTITSDRFVNKGPDRPVFPEKQRAELVAGLAVVDFVSINDWDSAIETIRRVRPNLFIKGDEYESRAVAANPDFIAETNAIREAGGKVAFTHGLTLSSTAAIRRLEEGNV